MTVKTLGEKLSLKTLVSADATDRIVTTGFCGDLLSWVIGRAKKNSAWITIMGNENAVAVATLADIPVIILAENAELDSKAAIRAKENNITVYQSCDSAYNLAVSLSKLLETTSEKEL